MILINISEHLHDFEVLEVGELGGQVVERRLEDVVHYRRAADPEFLAGGGQHVGQVLLVPPGGLLAGKTHHEVEMLRVKLVQQTQHPQAAGLSLVEVGHVVGKLEVIADLGSLFFVHFAHHEAGHVRGEVHERDGAGACCERQVLAGLPNAKRFAHRSFDHPSRAIPSERTFKHPS